MHGSPLRLWFLQWRKRAQDRHSAPGPHIVGCFLGTPTLVSPRGDCRKINPCDLTIGNLAGIEKSGERLEMTSPRIWADWVPTCRAHVQFPTGSFSSAEPRRWCNLTRKRGGEQACLSEVFKQRTLPALEPCQPFPCPGSVAES